MRVNFQTHTYNVSKVIVYDLFTAAKIDRYRPTHPHEYADSETRAQLHNYTNMMIYIHDTYTHRIHK